MSYNLIASGLPVLDDGTGPGSKTANQEWFTSDASDTNFNGLNFRLIAKPNGNFNKNNFISNNFVVDSVAVTPTRSGRTLDKKKTLDKSKKT